MLRTLLCLDQVEQTTVLWRDQGKVSKSLVPLARWSEVGTCSAAQKGSLLTLSRNGPRPARVLAKVLKQSHCNIADQAPIDIEAARVLHCFRSRRSPLMAVSPE